jgi:O-antigen/teichoic acid export membrane protein
MVDPPAPATPLPTHALRRVAKNAAAPMVAAVANKAMDIVFAIVLFKNLGPTDAGRFTWAVLIIGYLDILINFGLGILITREVARNREAGGRLLGGALVARFALWALALVLALAVAGPFAGQLGLTPAMGVTLVLLVIGIGVSNLAGLLSALFNAVERMEFPAGVTVVTTAAKVGFGTAALVLGFGIVGLAIASIVTNILTAIVLASLAIRVLRPPRPVLNPAVGLRLAREAYPLMINNLLASVFFRVDGILLRAVWGDTALGWYGAAYKVVDGLNVIPSGFVLALFPAFSRAGAITPGASEASKKGAAPRPDLYQGMVMALRVLFAAAFPIAVGITLLAEPIIGLVAGPSFLPHGAIALQVLIWFIPFSFANGLLQYVLIAANRQHMITVSFMIASAFNIVGNLLMLPRWGYVAAAVMTVLSELVLLGPFLIAVRTSVGPLALLPIAWRPALAAAIMAPAVWAVAALSPLLAVPVGAAVYIASLFAAQGVTRAELTMLRSTWSHRSEPTA